MTGYPASANAETVWLLLEHGADVTARDGTHSTPLHLALSMAPPEIEIVRLLIKHGADVNALDGALKMPIHLSLAPLQRRDPRRRIGNPVYIDEPSYREETPYVSTEAVQVLIEHGADVTVLGGTHSTPLHLALSTGSPELVRLLIKHGADVNAPDVIGRMPLHLALDGVSFKTGRLLLQHRADAKEQSTSTSFSHNIRVNTEIVQVLLEHGADATARDDTHSTPLHLVSSMGSPKIARLLIEHGADVTARNGTQSTPLHLASSSSPEIVRLLIEHGADVNALDGNREMPLHLALVAEVGVQTA